MVSKEISMAHTENLDSWASIGVSKILYMRVYTYVLCVMRSTRCIFRCGKVLSDALECGPNLLEAS